MSKGTNLACFRTKVFFGWDRLVPVGMKNNIDDKLIKTLIMMDENVGVKLQ